MFTPSDEYQKYLGRPDYQWKSVLIGPHTIKADQKHSISVGPKGQIAIDISPRKSIDTGLNANDRVPEYLGGVKRVKAGEQVDYWLRDAYQKETKEARYKKDMARGFASLLLINPHKWHKIGEGLMETTINGAVIRAEQDLPDNLVSVTLDGKTTYFGSDALPEFVASVAYAREYIEAVDEANREARKVKKAAAVETEIKLTKKQKARLERKQAKEAAAKEAKSFIPTFVDNPYSPPPPPVEVFPPKEIVLKAAGLTPSQLGWDPSDDVARAADKLSKKELAKRAAIRYRELKEAKSA